MSKVDDGGPVYPEAVKTFDSMTHHEGLRYVEGITRRDWLAGLVLQGLCSNPSVLNTEFFEDMLEDGAFHSGVDFSYRTADSMIAQGKL